MTNGCEVLKLAIANIAVGSRIGFFNADHAVHLGARMAAEGQQSPIHVKRNGNAAKQRWTLVAGLHRLRGAEGIGWTEIDAIQVADAGATDADLRRLELAENLSHRHRRPIERAIMMVEHARLEEAIDHPGREDETSQLRAARKRWNSATTDASVIVTDASGWRERTAQAFGCSISSVERHQRIHRAIVEALPDLAQRLNDHAMGESFSAMMRLAGIKMDDARRKAVETILSKPDWNSMDEVLVTAGLTLSTGNRNTAEHGTNMMIAWKSMSRQDKKAHVEWLARQVTPGQALKMVATFKERGLLP